MRALALTLLSATALADASLTRRPVALDEVGRPVEGWATLVGVDEDGLSAVLTREFLLLPASAGPLQVAICGLQVLDEEGQEVAAAVRQPRFVLDEKVEMFWRDDGRSPLWQERLREATRGGADCEQALARLRRMHAWRRPEPWTLSADAAAEWLEGQLSERRRSPRLTRVEAFRHPNPRRVLVAGFAAGEKRPREWMVIEAPR